MYNDEIKKRLKTIDLLLTLVDKELHHLCHVLGREGKKTFVFPLPSADYKGVILYPEKAIKRLKKVSRMLCLDYIGD